MGDADKPNAEATSSPYIDHELLSLTENIDTVSEKSPAFLSREIRSSIERLHKLGLKTAAKGDRYSRRFFWFYFRDEIERLRLKKEALRELQLRDAR